MLCSQSEAAHYARMLLSGYPNGNPADPQFYLTNVVALFTRYEHDIVRDACLPTGIPHNHPTFLPTTGEIETWLAKVAASRERIARYHERKPLPRPKPHIKHNVLVRAGMPGFDQAMTWKDTAKEDEFCIERTQDTVTGVWIPLTVWHLLRGRAAKVSA